MPTAVTLPATALPRPAAPPGEASHCLADGAPSITVLFGLVQRDSEGAFPQLHARTHPRVHAAVHQVLRSADLTREVVQEVYLEVWLQRHTFDPDRGSVLGWMTTIARRRAVDRVRSITSARGREDRYARGAPEPVVPDHQDRSAATLDAVGPVRRALAQLTQVQREALVLTYWRGHSTPEAASLLGIPVATMKSRMHGARARLRRLLDAPAPLPVAPAAPGARPAR